MSANRQQCELHEIELSSLLDGELALAAAAAALEHAFECADCRDFFRRASRLQGVATAPAASGDPMAPERAEQLWRGVLAAAGNAESAAPRGAGAIAVSRWDRFLRIAALLALGVGGGLVWSRLSSSDAVPVGAGEAVAVSAGGTARAMDERRFVAVADELLRSDIRYQRAMLEVLRLVPAIESGEGLDREDGPRGVVHARLDEESPRGGAI